MTFLIGMLICFAFAAAVLISLFIDLSSTSAKYWNDEEEERLWQERKEAVSREDRAAR